MNVSIRRFERLPVPEFRPVHHGKVFIGNEKILEKEVEEEQFYIKFNSMPVKQNEVDAAFDQLKVMFKHELETKGLLK